MITKVGKTVNVNIINFFSNIKKTDINPIFRLFKTHNFVRMKLLITNQTAISLIIKSQI